MTLTMLWPSGRHSERFEPSFIAFHREISEKKKNIDFWTFDHCSGHFKALRQRWPSQRFNPSDSKKKLLFLNAEHVSEWRISLVKGLQLDCAPLILEFSI